MLYFDYNSDRLYKSNDRLDEYESFTPTLDLTSGYLVVYNYTTYDSFGPDDYVRWEVIDFYPTKEEAEKVVTAMSGLGSWRTFKKEDFTATHADGSKIYAHWMNWGVKMGDVFVIEVEKIEDVPKNGRQKFSRGW